MSWDLFLAPECVGPACDFALKALTEAFHRPVLAMNQEGPVCVTLSGKSLDPFLAVCFLHLF